MNPNGPTASRQAADPAGTDQARTVPAAGHSPEEVLLAFATAVRCAGVNVTADRSRSFVDAVSRLGVEHRADVFWAGRATLCSAPEDLDAYTRTFQAWFSSTQLSTTTHARTSTTVMAAALEDENEAGGDAQSDTLRAIASSRELLRHRDIATLDDSERTQLAGLFRELPVVLPTRITRRRRVATHGSIDRIHTLRDQLRRGGEPGPLRYARARHKSRRVVWLIDISGSMSPYADSLLRLAHRVVAAAPRQVEVFTLGTRLTRVTAAMRIPDADDALDMAGRTVPDWSGGTRLGEVLRAFNERWGQRAVTRSSVVVIASDGWERGDPTLLGQQLARLHHVARRIIWTNPHRGKAGYAPVQQGILAVLAHVDDFVDGHSLASFEELLGVMGNA